MEDANQGESSKVLEFPEDGVIVINGVTYSSKGYEVCGVRNQHQKPCMRIGRCPFHPKPERDAAASSGTGGKRSAKNSSDPPPIIKKAPFKQGWTREEHLRFLQGLQIHGKGAWKEIAAIVGTRSATQIQSHAQKYFLRQKQTSKNKRSIHDVSLEDLQADENKNLRSTLPPISVALPLPTGGSAASRLSANTYAYANIGLPLLQPSADPAGALGLVFGPPQTFPFAPFATPFLYPSNFAPAAAASALPIPSPISPPVPDLHAGPVSDLPDLPPTHPDDLALGEEAEDAVEPVGQAPEGEQLDGEQEGAVEEEEGAPEVEEVDEDEEEPPAEEPPPKPPARAPRKRARRCNDSAEGSSLSDSEIQ